MQNALDPVVIVLAALEDFFEDGDSVAEYEMCSVFLDDLAFWSQNENIGEFGL